LTNLKEAFKFLSSKFTTIPEAIKREYRTLKWGLYTMSKPPEKPSTST
jgi:hypothetical protein